MNILSNGGTVLVVGLKPNQIPPDYLSDSRFVFWSALGNNNSLSKREIPSNCKALIMTRFLSHALFRNLVDQAKRRNLTVFPVLNTGEVKKNLDLISNKELHSVITKTLTIELPSIPQIESKDEPMTEKKKPNSGIRDFILANTDFSDPPSIDMPRVCELLNAARGLNYTPKKLQSAYFDAKKKVKGKKFSIKNVVPAKAETVGDLFELLDSAMTSLELMKEEVQSLDSLKAENHKLRTENAELNQKLYSVLSVLKG